MTTVLSTDVLRADYNRVAKFWPDHIINPSTLRLEAELKASINSYKFKAVEGSSDGDLEVKLERNDAFVITHIALGIRKQNKVSVPAKHANYPVLHHADANYFVGAQGGVTEAECLEALFNGTLSVSTSPIERLSDFLTNHFKVVPNRGHIIASGDQIGDEQSEYGGSLAKRGFVRLQPQMVLNGGDNNEVELKIGAGVNALIKGGVAADGSATDETNVVVVMLHGYKILNGSRKQDQYNSAI